MSCCAVWLLAILYFWSSTSRLGWYQTWENKNNKDCKLLQASPPGIGGSEDIVTYTKNMFITGEADLITMFTVSPAEAVNGNLTLVDARDPEKPTVKRMTLRNFPDNVDFQPHGIYYLPEKNLLHVINHAYKKGGERIDVFNLNIQPDDNSSEPEAEWLYAWTNDFITQKAQGALNDLAVVDADHLFVTRFSDREGDDGRQAQATWFTTWFTNIRRWALFYRKPTEFFYCTRDPVKDTSTCEVVDTGFSEANGINFVNDEKTLLYVNDLFEWKLRVYSIDRQANNKATFKQVIPLPIRVDNIEWNTHTKMAYLGTLDWETGAGGTGVLDPKEEDPQMKTLVMDDGSQLLHISGANFAEPYAFMGSWHKPGVLACKVAPEETAQTVTPTMWF